MKILCASVAIGVALVAGTDAVALSLTNQDNTIYVLNVRNASQSGDEVRLPFWPTETVRLSCGDRCVLRLNDGREMMVSETQTGEIRDGRFVPHDSPARAAGIATPARLVARSPNTPLPKPKRTVSQNVDAPIADNRK